MATSKPPPTPVVLKDEWDKLILGLRNELTEDDLKTLLYYYESPMEIEGEELMTTQQRFYNVVDRDDDKLSAAIQLENKLRSLRFHSGLGENLASLVQRYIDRLKAYLAQFDIEEKSIFIGREKEVELVQELIAKEESVIGVVICGFGGQGKTSLARQVCLNLGKDPITWRVGRASLRDEVSTTEVIRTILVALGLQCPHYSQQNELENILKQFIQGRKENLVLWLDDCDLVLKSDGQVFSSFLYNIRKANQDMNDTVKLRFLMTMREKVPDAKEILTVKNPRCRITYLKKTVITKTGKYTLAELELDALDASDAIELLRTCSKPVTIEERVADEIVKECAHSPLAIKVMAELVSNEKFSPEKLLFHLKMDTRNVTKALKVDVCLKQAIESLDSSHQNALVAMSVFQSSPFDARAARKVMETCVEDKSLLTDHLKSLYHRHLVEIEGDPRAIFENKDLEAREMTDKNSKMVKGRTAKNKFSLHPLVFRYISEWKKPKELQVAYENAVKDFVEHFEEVISGIVRQLESKYWKGQRLLQTNKVHILRFYDILDEHPKWLRNHEKRTSNNGIYKKKRMSDLADILLPIVKNRRIFQNEADRALRVGNDDVYVFWMVEKADVFLMLHDKVEIAIRILDDLTDGKFAALRNFHEEPFYRPLVHALFHKVKGLCRWKQNNHDEALKHLKLALRFYGKCERNELYQSFIARLKCYMGQIELDLGKLDRADSLLRKGYKLVKNMVECEKQDKDDLAHELHWDIPRYYNHFAVVKLRKAKAEEDNEKRAELLDLALQDLERGIRLDEQLKMNYLDGYYTKFKLRADVNVEKGLLEEALRDAMYASDHRRMILQPPHTHYTESVYQVGRIYMLIGDKLEIKGDKDGAQKHWLCSSDYFGELKECHLKEGGISLTNPVYQDIKRDHLRVIGLIKGPGDQKKLEKFYQDLEKGRFKSTKVSSQKSIIQMLYTPMEMVKKYFGGGGAEFGDQEHKLENLENLARVQQERMARGEPCGGKQRDSGRGHSSSELGESFSSVSGSMSSEMKRLHLEKSVSLEDNVFEEVMKEEREEFGVLDQPQPSTGKRRTTRPPSKRQKSEMENDQ